MTKRQVPDASLSSKDPAEGDRDMIERELKRQDRAAQGRDAAKENPSEGPSPKSVMDRTKGLP
jgi:hypothetical protein